MHLIVLYGDRDDGVLGKAFLRALHRYGGVVRLSADRVEGTLDPVPEYLITEYDTPPRLRVERGVFVFKNKVSCPLPVEIPSGFTAVAHSASASALALLKHTDCPAVVCGMSSRDTVTLSGLQEPSAAVSVQRQIVDWNGGVIEAREIPVSLSTPLEGYSLLAACAVLLLTQGEPEQGFAL